MDLAHLDATAQAELVRSGELEARELVESAIERIEKIDPQINAVIHRRFERALDEAARVDPRVQPFAGVPLVLKDASCPQSGEPHHQGMRVLRDLDFRESQDSWLVERFRAAGFVVVGRSNTPELACMPTAESWAYGPCRNPWNLEHSTGGSSGGSAAAVAAGLVPVAHGGDGGGSIRMPAGCCGLVGLKSARGRITRGPGEAEAWAGLAIDGVMTRSVRDTAAVVDAIAGPGIGDPGHAPPLRRTLSRAVQAGVGSERQRGLRIGVRREAYADGDATHPEVIEAVDRAEAALAELGHALQPASPSALDEAHISTTQGLVVSSCVAAVVEDWSRRIGREIGLEELEPVNARTVEAARRLSAVEYVRALAELHAWTRRVVAWWEEFDLLLLPTITDLTPRLGEMHSDLPPEALAALRRQLGWLTPPWNVTGQPAISLPVHWSDSGLPIGVQLVAAPDREDLLVEVAESLERVFGWTDRHAPVHG